MTRKHIKIGDHSRTGQVNTGGVAATDVNIGPLDDVTPTTIFDTTAGTLDTSSGFYSTAFESTIPQAQSFTTGSDPSILSDVELDLADSNPSDGGSLTVELLADDGGPGPGAIIGSDLGTILDSSLSASNQLIDVPVSNGATLDANTRYWIRLYSSHLPASQHGPV